MATLTRLGLSLISMPYHAGTPAVGMGLGPTALLERHRLADAMGEDVEVGVADPRGEMAKAAIRGGQAIRASAAA